MEYDTRIIPVIRRRRSVRKFSDNPVEREKIRLCVEAARLAPSAENVQPWRFIILDDPEIKEAFAKKVFSGIYSHTRWALNSPVLIVMAADINILAHKIGGGLQKIPYHMLDIGIAGEHFILQATELGLGTCWIGWFNLKKAQKFLGLPRSIKVCELIALGYPHKTATRRHKTLKPLETVLHFNSWEND